MSLIRQAVTSLKKIFVAKRPGLVLALGGGGAAGIAHIGVLQVLAENNIPVRAIAGTSIGAEIGAFTASGMTPDAIAEIALSFDWKQTALLFLPDLPPGGLISGARIVDFLNRGIGPHRIEDLDIGYVAVAADLETGRQVVIDRGAAIEAVRASISLPGIMAPYRHNGHVLVDGGVLNPVPFDVARERFGGPVVAVAVHSGARGLNPPKPQEPHSPQWPTRVRQLLKQPWIKQAEGLRIWLEAQLANHQKIPRAKPYWIARRVLERARTMAMVEMVRLRAAQSPPDLVLAPDVEDIGLLEFYRARDAIEAGRQAARESLPALRQLLDSGR
jgi:NTE family protein